MLERRACVRSSGRVQESILAGRLCRLAVVVTSPARVPQGRRRPVDVLVPRDLPWAGGLIGETPCRVPAASLPPGSFSSPKPPIPPLLLWRLSSRPACLVPLSASLFPTCLPTGYAAMEYVKICFRSYFKFFWMDINLEGELVDHMVTLF